MRYLSDGSILFSRSEKLPNNLDGYRRDEGNIYLFLPEPGPCKHRCQVNRLRPCGKIQIVYICKLLNQDVNMKICNECDLIEE